MSKKIKYPDGGIPEYKLDPIDPSIIENMNARLSKSVQATGAIKELEKQEFREFTNSITQGLVNLVAKQTEMIDKQSETINQISALVGKQQEI